MIIRQCLSSDAAGIESLFREFLEYLCSIGDESDYRFGAQQYLADGFGDEPAFRGLVAEDATELIGYVLFSEAMMVIMSVTSISLTSMFNKLPEAMVWGGCS